MKVSVEISPEYTEPYAVIYTNQMTDDIQRVVEVFGNSESPITALLNEEDLIILQPKEIYMVRVENGDTIIYGKQQKYRSRKRLYELGQQLVLPRYILVLHSSSGFSLCGITELKLRK